MEVSRQMEQLRQKANELEQRDVESLQQMVKNKKLAEDALMERDQVKFERGSCMTNRDVIRTALVTCRRPLPFLPNKEIHRCKYE